MMGFGRRYTPTRSLPVEGDPRRSSFPATLDNRMRNTYALALAVLVIMVIGAGLFIQLNNGMVESSAPLATAGSINDARARGVLAAPLTTTPTVVASSRDTIRILESWVERRRWVSYSWLFFRSEMLSDTLKLVLRVETPGGSEAHLQVRTTDGRTLRTRLQGGVRFYYLDDFGTSIAPSVTLYVLERTGGSRIGSIALARRE